jgi:hypothetical protein
MRPLQKLVLVFSTTKANRSTISLVWHEHSDLFGAATAVMDLLTAHNCEIAPNSDPRHPSA